jgi:hypothetical protein
MLWPLFSPGKELEYLLDRRLGGPKNWSGQHGKNKILAHTGTQTGTPRSSNPWPIAIPTALSRFHYGKNYKYNFKDVIRNN